MNLEVRAAGAEAPPRSRARRAAGLALSAAAIAPVALVLRVALGRMAHPFDLEWMEGAMVDHVQRVVDGAPLWIEPSFDWTPFIYNPLYLWLSALVARLTGVGYLPLRLVSVLSIAATFALLADLVRRETRSPVAGLLAAGLFASTYELGGGFLDTARVDALFVALSVAALHRARFAKGPAGAAVAGALLALAFLTKQYAFALAPPLALGILLRRGARDAAAFALSALGPSLLAVGALHVATGGWYTFYAFEVPAAHGRQPFTAGQLLWDQMARPAPLLAGLAVAAAIAAAVAAARSLRRPHPLARLRERHAVVLHAGAVGALATMAYASRMHTGSASNNLIVWHLGASLAAALLVGAAWRGRAGPALGALCAAQIGLLWFSPARWIPDEANVRAGERFVERLRAEESVLVPYQSHLPVLAGHPPVANQMAILDLLKMPGDPRGVKAKLLAEAEARFASGRYGRVILNNTDYVFQAQLARHYRRAVPAAGHEKELRAFRTLVAWRTRPARHWIPNASGERGGAAEPRELEPQDVRGLRLRVDPQLERRARVFEVER